MRIDASLVLLCLGTLLSPALSSRAFAAGEGTSLMVEIPVEAVFVPERGYDNNDNVELVIYGRLPNPCYKLGPSKTRMPHPGLIQVAQFAFKNTSGICGQGEALPPHLNVTIPFTTTVAVGQLPSLEFIVNFRSALNRPAVRRFSVDRATSPGIDNLPYAMVTGVSAPDLISPDKAVEIQITGMLPSSCYSLEPSRTEVRRVGDAYVVLPVMSVETKRPCLEMLVPFSEKVLLGPALAERFLVHVRSMSGRSFNHVAETLPLLR